MYSLSLTRTCTCGARCNNVPAKKKSSDDNSLAKNHSGSYSITSEFHSMSTFLHRFIISIHCKCTAHFKLKTKLIKWKNRKPKSSKCYRFNLYNVSLGQFSWHHAKIPRFSYFSGKHRWTIAMLMKTQFRNTLNFYIYIYKLNISKIIWHFFRVRWYILCSTLSPTKITCWIRRGIDFIQILNTIISVI